MTIRLPIGLLLVLLAAGCDRRAPADPPSAGVVSAKEKARVAADAAKFEAGLRIANLEKRVDLLEAELAVGPKTRDHLELDLIKARVDKLEMDATIAAEAARQQAAAATRSAAKLPFAVPR